MNKVILVGRLVKEADLKIINENLQVLKFSLAVERDYKTKDGNKPVDFINCEYMGKDFTKLCNFLEKGKLVLVEGSLNIDKVEEKYFTKVKVDKLKLLSSNSKPSVEAGGFSAVEDDDTPF